MSSVSRCPPPPLFLTCSIWTLPFPSLRSISCHQSECSLRAGSLSVQVHRSEPRGVSDWPQRHGHSGVCWVNAVILVLWQPAAALWSCQRIAGVKSKPFRFASPEESYRFGTFVFPLAILVSYLPPLPVFFFSILWNKGLCSPDWL